MNANKSCKGDGVAVAVDMAHSRRLGALALLLALAALLLGGESYAQKAGESKKNAAAGRQELVEQMKAKGMSDEEIEQWLAGAGMKSDGKNIKASGGKKASPGAKKAPGKSEATQGDWKRLPDMPVGKWEPGTVILDNKLYVFGGYTAGVRSSKRCDVFDPKDGSWTQIQDLPSAISHVNMVLDGRTVWFAGGFKDGYKGHTIAEVWNYDIDKDRYTAAPLLPETRGGGGLALVGRKLHYFGGNKADRDTDAPDHWVLDLDEWAKGAAQWKNAAPMPVPRNQFSTVTFEGKIYAIGGQFHHDSEQDNQPRVDIYDPESDTWGLGPALHKGHSHAEGATFVHDGRIYMVGGHSQPKGGRLGLDANIVALAPGGSWEVVDKLPAPLSSPAAAIIGGKLYVASGFDGRVKAEVWVTDAP